MRELPEIPSENRAPGSRANNSNNDNRDGIGIVKAAGPAAPRPSGAARRGGYGLRVWTAPHRARGGAKR